MAEFTGELDPFPSGPPGVRLVNAFARPYENALATARTCYSASGIIGPGDVSGDGEPDPDRRAALASRRDALARSIYQAGHHTTLQHGHFQFALDNVSRQFIWSFLHAHPFYNSEQVSQRYVEVKPGSCVVPPLPEPARRVYDAALARQMDDYRRLIDVLTGPVESEYLRLFPARRGQSRCARDVKKRAQELARYVLPVATTAYLYHTVSGLTLLRYWRLSRTLEAGLETRWVVGRMVEELLKAEPLYSVILQEPLPLEETPEWHEYTSNRPLACPGSFREEFDGALGGRVSVLVDWKRDNEGTVARSVREVLGLTRAQMDDATALALVLDPDRNRLLGETMNLTTHSKLARCLFHASYTFRKKLSHAADSQDQRHRMIPGSRPLLAAHADGTPDAVVPALVASDEPALSLFTESMDRSWEAARSLHSMGVPADLAGYLLPNAQAVRFTESADLLNLHHKLKSRLCYNAQEEIWRASVDEALAIREVNPVIGRYLLPPCTLRKMAHVAPICPEGDRYCGVPVWRITVDQYRRVI
jgi:thymidylate synthase ThyX